MVAKTFDALLLEFTQSLIRRKYQQNSARDKGAYIRCHFTKFFYRECEGEFHFVSLKKCNQFIEGLTGSGKLKPGSVQNIKSACAGFWSWLEMHDYVQDNPWKRLPPLRADTGESPTEPLAPAKMMEMLSSEPSARWRAMWEMYYGTGARLMEIRNVLMRDLKFEADGSGWVHVIAKGRKERTLRLRSRVVKAIKEYLGAEVRKPEDPLWPCEHWTRTKDGIVGPNSINAHLRLAAERVGLEPKKVHSHVFRHSFATHMWEAGAEGFAIQKALGHKWITTTQRYVHGSKEEIADKIGEAQERLEAKLA